MKKRILQALLIMTMILSLFATSAFASPNISLVNGASGADVKTLQTYLMANGFSVTANGEFDSETENAVKQYQASLGLEATGVMEAKTFERLARVEEFIKIAYSKMGVKYVRGGKGPSKFDCSGFVYWTMNQAGIKQGYMNSAAWQKCKTYQKIKNFNSLMRGDVISFKGHVAIYLGNGQMINASSSNKSVAIAKNIQRSSYWKKNFVAGYRIF